MRRALPLAVLIVGVLVAVRAALPELIERYVNRVLDERTDKYEGRIEDVDLSLWRGAYTIDGLHLDHERVEELRPLLRADRIDLSISWRALLRGELAGEVEVQGFVYNVVAAPPESDAMLAQTGETPDLSERLSDLFPFSIDRLEIHDGELHYLDPHRSPKVDVALTEARLLAVNWDNTHDRSERRFGRAWLRSRIFESGRLAASLEADPMASPPEFMLAAIAKDIQLEHLNDFLRAYGGFDAEKGVLSLFLEVEAEDVRYAGYVKPLVSGLDVLGEEEGDDWIDRIWEGVVGVLAEIFENQAVERQATRIPIEGTWEEPTPDLLRAIANVLYNAFIQALPARLEHPERLQGDDAEDAEP